MRWTGREEALPPASPPLGSVIVQSFELRVDEVRQILRVTFCGVVGVPESETLLECIRPAVDGLKPGFTVVCDLSELQQMDVECAANLARLMDLFRGAGVGRVLRIIPDPAKDIGFTILSHTHYRGRVPFQTVRSRREAEAALEWATLSDASG